MGTAGYRGSVALDVAVDGLANSRALALTCWDDSFSIHGAQSLPTPPPRGPLVARRFVARTDLGTEHHDAGGGGHGHPRFLWHTRLAPALPRDASTVALSATAPDGTAATARLTIPRPLVRSDTAVEVTDGPGRARPRVDHSGDDPPRRVVTLGADLGALGGVHRALTTLYLWPTWFLLTIEARGELDWPPAGAPLDAWELEDERGNHYVGHPVGSWRGPDHGAHIACGPGLDDHATSLRVRFPDPFGHPARLTATAALTPPP